MKIFKNTVIIMIFLSFIITTASCTFGKHKVENVDMNITTYPVTIKDLAGRNVQISKKPITLISLAPGSTEILFALGLGKNIAGVTDSDDYPPEAKDIDKVYGNKGLNIDAIKEKKPDVVFASSSLATSDLNKIVNLNIPVVISDARNFSGVYDSINLIARITGRQSEAATITAQMKSKVAQLKKLVAGKPKVKTYYVLKFGSLNLTGGKGTLIDDIINIAGGINVADTLNGWGQFNPTQLAGDNPQVMIISRHAGNINTLVKANGYKETEAIKNGRLISIDDNLVLRPGPRIVDGLDLVTRALHPELFK